MVLNDVEKEWLQREVAQHHYRNGKENEDGSRGTIDITPKQLFNLLSRVYQQGKQVMI